MKCDFTFSHYQECIEQISKKLDTEMIHDIDFAPDNLITMASIEHQFSVSSTYFIRIHAKTYNPFALPYLPMIKEIVSKYGHKLGLHFEPFYYKQEEIQVAIQNEIQALSSILKEPIKAISIHEPARFGSIDSRSVPTGITYYCWNAPYYSNKKYISDSGARWREGCMCQHLEKNNLIILTHLDHWYINTSAENY